MGKKARNKIRENNPDRTTEDAEKGRLRAWWGRRKERMEERVDTALDNATARAHKSYYKQWMARSGCNHPSLIKWDDPHISLEAKLCDIRNLKLIRKGARRDEFFSICTPEEIDVYLNGRDLMGGKYTDLEDGKILKSMIAGAKKYFMERKIKMSPEDEAQLAEAMALTEDVEDDENEAE